MVPCGIIRTFGLVTLLAAACVQSMKIHEQMTDDEIANFFDTTRDKVPDYDVVPVRHNLYKRSSPNARLQFTAFGKKIDVYLEPTDAVLAGENTPVWLASTKADGTVEYKKMRLGLMGIAVGMFKSNMSLSTILAIETEVKKMHFEGVLGDLIIRSLPKRFRETMRSTREIESPKTSRTLMETHYHVIIKSTSSTNENEKSTSTKNHLEDLEKQIHKTRSLNETNYSKSKRSTRAVVYPSILITTDLARPNTIQHELAYHDEIIYQLAFWNAVDLRFRQVDNPKIRLRIAGLIIGLDRGATPYFHKHRIGNTITLDDNWLDSQKYWTDMGKRPGFTLEAYDVVVTMTDNEVILRHDDGSWAKILGLAYTSSLCPLPNEQLFRGLALINDPGDFMGILTATHELGHIMGLNHDALSGDECDGRHRFIMQPSQSNGPNNIRWSPCSLRTLTSYLRYDIINCADEPAKFYPPGREVLRLLPGDIVDAEKQCKAQGFEAACDTTADTCTSLQCTYKPGTKSGFGCLDAGPAVEGTTCTPGHKCVDGVCQCLTEECIFKKIE